MSPWITCCAPALPGFYVCAANISILLVLLHVKLLLINSFENVVLWLKFGKACLFIKFYQQTVWKVCHKVRVILLYHIFQLSVKSIGGMEYCVFIHNLSLISFIVKNLSSKEQSITLFSYGDIIIITHVPNQLIWRID